MAVVVRARKQQPVDVPEEPRVPGRRLSPRLEDRVELLQLADPDRGANVVDPVVEPQPRVLQPPSPVGAALVPEAREQAPRRLRMRRHDSTLARGDLLVRVEGEDGVLSLRTHGPTGVPCAQRLAGVVDQHQPVAIADRLQFFQLARVAVDVDGHDSLRPRADGGFDCSRVEVPGARVDVCEDRRRTLVDRAVGGRDEGIGRRDHLVPGRDAGGDAEQVQPRRPARERSRVRRAHGLREQLLEPVDRRAEREPARAEHVDDELLLALVEPGRRQPDLAGGRRHALARAVSTTSSQWLQRSLRPFTVSA
jgi:hypothetical protein